MGPPSTISRAADTRSPKKPEQFAIRIARQASLARRRARSVSSSAAALDLLILGDEHCVDRAARTLRGDDVLHLHRLHDHQRLARAHVLVQRHANVEHPLRAWER